MNAKKEAFDDWRSTDDDIVDHSLMETTDTTPDNTNTNTSQPVGNNINASVGKGGTNNEDDVRVVQTLLNNHGWC